MATAAAKSIFIVGAKRTPFGAFGGSLKNLTATDLATASTKAALAAGNIDPAIVDSVFVGNVAQTSTDAAYIARHVALRSGVPITTPALTINRLCGSGFQSVVSGAQEILLGESEVSLCAGSESMSQAPLASYGHKSRWGVPLGKGLQLEDTLWSALTDAHIKTPMAITAENLAENASLSRQDCDEFALRSQRLWGEANEAGAFDAELAPVEYKGRKGMETLERDEHPRPQTQPEGLAKLKAVFKKDGVVTAGNASGICDGAGSIVLASDTAVEKHGLAPLAKLLSWNTVGVDPSVMGIGPVPAIRAAVARAGLSLEDVDMFEINEAFAAQFLACQKELGVGLDKFNTSGGAIALGHPLAASGSRITAHLTHALVRTGKRYAVGAACIGGGQGIAVVLENATL